MKTSKIHQQPLIAYIAVAFIAFYRCLVQGQSYFANDLLAWFAPMRTFLRDRLLSGDFPFWNPYLFGGQPYFSDLQTMMLYPLNYATLFFSAGTGLTLFFILHMTLAGWGMHLWMKSLKVSEGGAFIGGLSYCLSSFFWWELIHPPVLAAFAWLPWLMLSLERCVQKPSLRRAFFAGLIASQLFLAGAVQVTLGAFYVGLFYLLFRIQGKVSSDFQKDGFVPSILKNLRSASLLFLLFLLGSAPLFFQAIPTAEFSKYSVRRTPDLTYENFNGGFSLQPGTIGQFLFPTYSVPKEQTIETAIQTLHDGSENDFLANFGYLGIMAPFLFILAFRKKDRLVWFLAGTAVIAIMISFGKYFPLHRILCATFPGFSLIRVAFRFLYIYVLAGSALMALGYQELEDSSKKTVRVEPPKAQGTHRIPWVLLGSLSALFFIVVMSRLGQTGREGLGLLLGTSGLALLFFAPGLSKLGRLLFSSGVVIPLLWMGWSSFSIGPNSNLEYRSQIPSSIHQVLENSTPHRVFLNQDIPYPISSQGRFFDAGLPDNAAAVIPFKSIKGYNPLRLKNVSDLEGVPFPTLMRLMAVRSVLTRSDQGEIPFMTKKTVGGFFLYEMKPPLTCISSPTDLRIEPDPKARLDGMKQPDFEPYRTAYLDKPLPARISLQLTGKPNTLSYAVKSNEPDRQIYAIRTQEPSLVVFSEVNYPGWKVLVDGSPSDLFTANHIYRSVFVPAGEHEVIFNYSPWWRGLLFPGLILWCIAATTFLIFSFRSKPAPPTKV